MRGACAGASVAPLPPLAAHAHSKGTEKAAKLQQQEMAVPWPGIYDNLLPT
jgi:hypothetical protein